MYAIYLVHQLEYSYIYINHSVCGQSCGLECSSYACGERYPARVGDR